jgi:hypothetical protein
MCVEYGTGEIKPLLDVGRETGALEDDSHLVGNRAKQMLEYFKFYRVRHHPQRG